MISCTKQSFSLESLGFMYGIEWDTFGLFVCQILFVYVNIIGASLCPKDFELLNHICLKTCLCVLSKSHVVLKKTLLYFFAVESKCHLLKLNFLV